MFHSVRARLTLWYTGVLAVVLIAFSGISYFALAREIKASTDSLLASTADEFAAALAVDPSGSVGEKAPLDFRLSGRALMVFTSKGELIAYSRSTFSAADRSRMAQIVRRGFAGFATMSGGVENDGIRMYIKSIEVVGIRHVIVVAHDLRDQGERMENARRSLFFGIPIALLLAAGGGYVLARKSLAPVTAMSVKARQIGAETLTERVIVENERDELGFLGTTLNELLERLQRAFESQRSFMADASHELRTPLAIIQGEAEVSLSRAERSPAEYRESMSIIQTSARKLTRIVESLFLLARSDVGRYPINRTRFYLDELLADCVRALRSVASTRDVELTCASMPELIITADEALIHRMLLNLIDNALKFTPPGGRVTISAEVAGAEYIVRVSDTGIGIADSDRERIFERFYRGERTRSVRGMTSSTVSTGAGLGLPIARWIADIHNGKLLLEQSNESGTTFVVRIPRGADEEDPAEKSKEQTASSSV